MTRTIPDPRPVPPPEDEPDDEIEREWEYGEPVGKARAK